jgi:hypothetical protein
MKIIKTGGKMRRSHVLLTLCYFLLAGILAGCGGGSGSPGSSGSEETGIQIKAVRITNETSDFDVYQEPVACPLDAPKGPEIALTKEVGVISIDAAKLNPAGAFDPFPASVEECTITYKKANEDPSAPVIESLTIYPNCTINDSPTNSCAVDIIDLPRKRQYWNGITDGIHIPAESPTHYVAGYRCKYMNQIGKIGYFKVEFDFRLADFLICS